MKARRGSLVRWVASLVIAAPVRRAACGGWESAQKAQDATDAANDLGVDVTNFQNRKETAMALVAAGWTYFDYYNHKREEAAGNPNCGWELGLYGVSY
jgi:hypothetical protein